MNPKQILTDGIFCPIPWTGIMYNFDGTVKNCIRSDNTISVLGNIRNNSIEEIIHGNENLKAQSLILDSSPYPPCHTCYDIERGKKGLDMISDRIFYIRELKHQQLDLYEKNKFDLKVVDLRWSNLCNFGCIYCGPEFSSKWTKELNIIHQVPAKDQLDNFKDYIFKNAHQLQHVYLAGGEPLLMKENIELLDILKEVNPTVNLRINTNLSKTGTKVFDKICEFKNVHWTVSVESMDEEFEYIRYGGKWHDFLDNLKIINKTKHKVSFNMLYFLLNFKSFFNTIDYFRQNGYHPNSFIAGALLAPEYLNIRHLPGNVIEEIKIILKKKINEKPGYLLEDSYRNILTYVSSPFEKNLSNSIAQINELDKRRNIDSRQIFIDLYNILQ